jgi:hypothetical protein
MDAQTHWEKIYTEKAADAVSWYRPHLETSLALIEQAAAGVSASVIDVGGGESTLVDDLLGRGYVNITVLDISQTAIDANRKRLGKASERVHWLVANITQVELEPSAYMVWATGNIYPHTIGGLSACFLAGIPFYRNQILGDAFYTAAIFGGDALIHRIYQPTGEAA